VLYYKIKTSTMTIQSTVYRGYEIQKRTDEKTHTCIIYNNGAVVKCIAGNISATGSENSVSKAQAWIRQQINR